MFVFRKTTEAAGDALDLVVEFSTLGEYGFLPSRVIDRNSGSPPPFSPRARQSCGVRRRSVHKPDEPPRIQIIGALRTPRLTPDWTC